MNNKRLIRTLALALAIVGTPIAGSITGSEILESTGIIKEVQASDSVVIKGKDVDKSLFIKDSGTTKYKQLADGTILGANISYNGGSVSSLDVATGELKAIESQTLSKDYTDSNGDLNSDKIYSLGEDRYVTVGSDYSFNMSTYIRESGYMTIFDKAGISPVKFSTKSYSAKNTLISITGAGSAKDGNIALASICSQTNQFRPTGGNGSSYESAITVVQPDGKIVSTINLKNSYMIRDIIQLDDGTFLAYYPACNGANSFPETTSSAHVSHIGADGVEIGKVATGTVVDFAFVEDNFYIATGSYIRKYNKDMILQGDINLKDTVSNLTGLGSLEYSYKDNSIYVGTDQGVLKVKADLSSAEKILDTNNADARFTLLYYYPDSRILVYNSSASTAPYGKTGKIFTSKVSDNGEILNTYPDFKFKFAYKTVNGVDIYKELVQNVASIPDPSSVIVPEDKFNYKIFSRWDDPLTIPYKEAKTINAIYVDNESSFWDGNNRFGIIDDTSKTACFLGSRDANATVPHTAMRNGQEYTVTVMQNGSLTREGDIISITVDSSQLSKTMTGDSKLEKIKITGNSEMVTSVFTNNKSLKTLDMSEYSGNIPDKAFQGCTALTEIVAPKVNTIGDYSFQGCTALKGVSGLDSLVTIGNYAFSGCTGLTSITGTVKLTSTGSSTFASCSNLEVVQGKQSYVASKSVLTNKVYLYTPDESEVLGSYWVKSGANFKPYADKVGGTWIKISGSPIGNITANSEYKCATIGEATEKPIAPILTISKENPSNREDVTIGIS